MSATDGQSGLVENGWGTRPIEQRQTELEETLHEWEAESDHRDRCGPFDGKVLSGADVFWLAIHAAPNTNKVEVEQILRAPLADIREAVDLSMLHLEGANLRKARLEEAYLAGAHLEGANLDGAHLEYAYLTGAYLQGASLPGAHLEWVSFIEARLEGALLDGAQLQGALLYEAHLERASLALASFDKKSMLLDTHLNEVALGPVIFDNTDLSRVRWNEVRKLGDELRVENGESLGGRQHGYRTAAQAYRVLSVALRNQGVTEAARFHYRSEVMERKVLWCEAIARLPSRRFYRAARPCALWFVSWGLGFFMGYGNYISRLFVTYAGVVVVFAVIYLGITYQPATGHPLVMLPWPHAFAAFSWIRDLLSFCIVRVPAAIYVSTPSHLLDMLVFSVTAFHGRGLQQLKESSEVLIWWAGVEAVLGLLIEALFVAAFARRVTGG